MSECCMTRSESDTNGLIWKVAELVEQAHKNGYKAGYSKAENDYHAKTEDDRQSSYELGLNEAWEAASKVIKMGEYSRKFEVFPECGDGEYPFDKVSASEAIEKIRAYEAQKQEEDERIEVGDEVVFHNEDRPDTVMFVMKVAEDGFIDGMDAKGNLYAEKNPKNWTKTGRHLNEIAEVLKKMEEGE